MYLSDLSSLIATTPSPPYTPSFFQKIKAECLSSCFYNKNTIDLVAYKQQTFISKVLEAEKSKIKASAD